MIEIIKFLAIGVFLPVSVFGVVTLIKFRLIKKSGINY